MIFLDDEWLRIDERLPHRIKNLIPDENVRIIVIFTSPSPDVGLDAYTAMLQGCDDFLLWPCSGHELRARLHLSLRANRTFADLRRQRRDAASLLKLSQMLASSLDMRSILHTVSRLTADVVAFERCSIFLIGPAEGEVTLVAASEDAQMQELALPIAKYPELRTCIEQQRAVLIDDVQSDPLLGHVRSQIVEKGVRAMALFPIIFESQVLGVLFLRSSILSRLPSSLDMQFVQTVASSCAVAIRNAKLFESVREKASRVTSFQVLARKQSVLLKQYKNFFEAAADGMAIIDDKSKVIYLNREGRHLMDVDINDPEAMSEREIYFDDFLAPESQGQWQRLLQDVRVTHRHRMADVAVLLPDDRERRFSMAIGLAEKDTEFYVLSFRDVTMTRQMESELKTVKEFLEKLVDSSIDAIVATDTKGTILLFNKAAENLFGYTSDEVIGRIDASMLYAGGATNILRALYDERFGGVGRLDSHRSAIRSRSGEDIPVRMSASLLDDIDDGEEVIVCILADLRPQLEAEEQLEAARAKLHEAEKVQVVAELAGMAAHELNQPLTSVLGYAELIKNRYVNHANTNADDRMNHAVGVIYQQAMRMAEIVKKLGRITKYETKPYSGSTSIVDLDGSSKAAQAKNAAEQNYKTTKIHVPLHVVSANPTTTAKPTAVEVKPTLPKTPAVGVVTAATTNPQGTAATLVPAKDNKTFTLDATARNYQTPASLLGNGTAKQQRITQELRIPQFQHQLHDEKKAAAEKAAARAHESNEEKPAEKSLLSEQDDEITDAHLRRPRTGPKEGKP